MKKNHLFIAAILLIAMAAGSNVNAQTTKNISFLTDVKTMEKAMALSEPSDAINSRAKRDFRRSYPDVDDAQWYAFKDGFAAKFNDDGYEHMVTYNRVGDWQYTISNYDEKKLDENVRALVKSTYYDYTITLVQEITLHDQTIYVIHMQDATTWKTLKVADGEMSILEDFNKK